MQTSVPADAGCAGAGTSSGTEMPISAPLIGPCPECNARSILSGGDGRCSLCHGTGTNLHLPDPTPKCRGCQGTGVCRGCGGKGLVLRERPLIGTLEGDQEVLDSYARCPSRRRREKVIAICALAAWLALVLWRCFY